MSRPFAIALVVGRFVVGCVCVCVGLPRAARADGAFPMSFQLILPTDRPNQIVLATNFGMIISDDAGATWTWTCEQKATANATLYNVGAPPVDRFFGLASDVAYSDDQSCSWTSAKGSLGAVTTSDYFPDPTNPMRVLAVGGTPADQMSSLVLPPRVFPSSDGGKTFTDAIFTAPTGATITGLEIARSDPSTVYLALATTGSHPMLGRSRDGGLTWTSLDVEPFLGPHLFRIVAVDPTDAKVISVRVLAADSDSLAISRDGGQTFTTALTVSCGQLTAYTRLASGTILVAGAVIDQAVGYRSTDGGKTFTNWVPLTLGDDGVPINADAGDASASDAACDAADGPPPEVLGVPHLIALATRDGKLYGAAKNYSDGWAVGTSADEGLTWKPMMSYSDVKAIRPCAQNTCKDSCEFQASQDIWPGAICAGPPPKSGCGCRLDDAGGRASGAALLLAALCLARARRPRG